MRVPLQRGIQGHRATNHPPARKGSSQPTALYLPIRTTVATRHRTLQDDGPLPRDTARRQPLTFAGGLPTITRLVPKQVRAMSTQWTPVLLDHLPSIPSSSASTKATDLVLLATATQEATTGTLPGIATTVHPSEDHRRNQQGQPRVQTLAPTTPITPTSPRAPRHPLATHPPSLASNHPTLRRKGLQAHAPQISRPPSHRSHCPTIRSIR